MLLVFLLMVWVLSIAAGALAIREFNKLALGEGAGSRRATVPLMRLLPGASKIGVNTTIAGSDENPLYRPLVGYAEWAVKRDGWDANWTYRIALAYWKESMRVERMIRDLTKQIDDLRGEAEEATRLRAMVDTMQAKQGNYQRQAYQYLLQAIRKDPANGFYRWTASELGQHMPLDETQKRDLLEKAQGRVPENTILLILAAERLREGGKNEEALAMLKRALVQVKTELTSGVGAAGKTVGEDYLARIVTNLEQAGGNYTSWQTYVPEDAEVHLRLSLYLDEKGEHSEASEERRKGLETGERLIKEGKQKALMVYHMGAVCEKAGELDKAIDYTTQAAKLARKNVQWWMKVADLQARGALEASQRRDEALSMAETARRQDDAAREGSARATAQKETDAALGYLLSASETVEKVLEMEPTREDALNLMRTIGERRSKLTGGRS